MKYMGSKSAIAKHILPIITKNRKPNQYYVEPFVGGCNSIDKALGNRIGSDINRYLIAFWKKVQSGWIPPKFISREHYSDVRESYNNGDSNYPDYYKGCIGFNGSYGGRFFDGGYAGITRTKLNTERNYPLEAFKNVYEQIPRIQGIEFYACSYEDLPIPENSIIYCDPPYAETKKYKTVQFDYPKFWDWCREKSIEGHTVFVSEYNAPSDFSCVWQKEVSSSLRANGVILGNKTSVERLFTFGQSLESAIADVHFSSARLNDAVSK